MKTFIKQILKFLYNQVLRAYLEGKPKPQFGNTIYSKFSDIPKLLINKGDSDEKLFNEFFDKRDKVERNKYHVDKESDCLLKNHVYFKKDELKDLVS